MTPKVERLVNLTIALLEARRPLTLADIKRRTGFYRQADTESARRMFERDKDDLRSLGVPIETASSVFDDELGYVIHRRDYELADVNLTADEVAALSLAVRLTGGEGTRLTLSRLAARAPDPVDQLSSPALKVNVRTEALDAVADAVMDRRFLRFDYRTAHGHQQVREVEPYAVVQRRGSWYLVAHDRSRSAIRTFRLDRIVGVPNVGETAAAFDRPDDLDVARLVSGPEVAGVDVVLDVAPHARWAVESRGGIADDDCAATHPDGVVMRVRGIDLARDQPWLLGFGPDVIVREPRAFADQVLVSMQAVVDAHGGDA